MIKINRSLWKEFVIGKNNNNKISSKQQQSKAINDESDLISITSSSAQRKPKSAVEAARMSLRPRLRKTNSNRSLTSASVHSTDNYSIASSARMVPTTYNACCCCCSHFSNCRWNSKSCNSQYNFKAEQTC